MIYTLLRIWKHHCQPNTSSLVNINEIGRSQSDTYSSLFNKSDNVNVDETFVRKLVLVHVFNYTLSI